MLHAWSLTRWLAQGREEAGVRVRPDSVSPSCPEPGRVPMDKGRGFSAEDVLACPEATIPTPQGHREAYVRH